MSDKCIKINYYTSEKGIFFTNSNKGFSSRCSVEGALINGKKPEKTQHDRWHFLPDETEIKTVQKNVRGKCVNYRWQLIDPDSQFVKDLPKVLSQIEANELYDDDEYCWEISEGSKYYEVRNLYSRCHDLEPDHLGDEEFEAEHVGEIQSDWANNPVDVKYKVYRTSYKHQGEEGLDLSSIARYSDLDSMLIPDLFIHNRPCSLGSISTYRIIRNWVCENIDPKISVVTSDYDFCFTVKKKIAIQPFIRKTEVYKANGKSYKSPRFNTRQITHDTVEVFQMSPKPYQKYTVVEGFKGESLEDLNQTIRAYLDELIEYINAPVSRCPECDGTGHVFCDKFSLNKREEK